MPNLALSLGSMVTNTKVKNPYLGINMTVTGNNFFDNFLLNIGQYEQEMLQGVIHNEIFLQHCQVYMYRMVDRNFRSRRNSSGSPWEPLSDTTISIRSKGYSRIGGKGGAGARYTRDVSTPLMASGEYYLSWMGRVDSSLHYITKGSRSSRISIGSRKPQLFNEFGGTIKSKMFRGKRVPARSHAYFGKEDIDTLVNKFSDEFTEWIGRMTNAPTRV
jgi:hypothetical protein